MRVSIACAALVALTAACLPKGEFTPRSSGSIGLTFDDALLYVADADHDELVVLDAETLSVIGRVAVGRAPERVLVAPDGTIYVSNRGDRSVSRIEPGALVESVRGLVGGEPVGMSLTDDGYLLVANATSGTLSVLDAHSLEEIDRVVVGGMPWAVTAIPGTGQAYVTDFLSGDVTLVSAPYGRVERRIALVQPQLDECAWFDAGARVPAQPADVILSPDGDRAYVAHVQSRTGTDGIGNQSLALAVAPALGTIDTSTQTLVTRPAGGTGDIPSPLLAGSDCDDQWGGGGMDAPSSLVIDATGDWLYVADHNSNALAIVSARGSQNPSFFDPERGIADLVRVGARPTGIAVSGDLTRAYVHSAFDYEVAVVERDAADGRLGISDRVRFADSPLPVDVERGRRLFYSAVDPRMTQPELGGVSCSSCHPDGRTDGLSWVLPGQGGRDWSSESLAGKNTQALWNIADTAPYRWDDSTPDLETMGHAMVAWMGGGGLRPADASDLTAYVRSIPSPDNPAEEQAPSARLTLGEALFAAECAGCHAGEMFTDAQVHADIGTPSLRGVFATAPYLHDGSARTLRDAIRTSGAHTFENRFDSAELDALDHYLGTL